MYFEVIGLNKKLININAIAYSSLATPNLSAVLFKDSSKLL